MNPCQRVESLLSAYEDNETSPAETRYVAGHLTACKRCRTASQDLELLRRRIQLMPKSRVSEGFTGRVLDAALGRKPAGLDEPLIPERTGPLHGWVVPLQAAAVLVLAVFLGVQWWQARSPEMPVAQSQLKDAIHSAETAKVVESQPPSSVSLSQTDPAFGSLDAQPASIGLAGEELALDDWTLVAPRGGGQPVLTRVGSAADNKVVVSY